MKTFAYFALIITSINFSAFAFEPNFAFVSARTSAENGLDLGRSAVGYGHLTVKGDFSLGENEVFVTINSCVSASCGWSLTGPFNSPAGRDSLKDGEANVFYTNIKTQLGLSYQIGVAKCQKHADGIMKGMLIFGSCQTVALSPVWKITRKGVEILN